MHLKHRSFIPNGKIIMELKLLHKIESLRVQFPEDKLVLHELYHDTIDRRNKAHWNFLTYLVSSWGVVFGYTAMNGPLPILKRRGSFLSTHRLTRQYAYLGLLSFGLAYYPLYKTVTQTCEKLDLVAENKKKKDEGFIRPIAPIHYPNN